MTSPRGVRALGDFGRRTARDIAIYHEPTDEQRELIAVAFIEGLLAGFGLDQVGRARVLASLGVVIGNN
ncbi:MAG: hypothetical protein KF718_02485 [Polyangiaceae bacterium]|nr:hypothetical protein [Polyangiaceae bacterium]